MDSNGFNNNGYYEQTNESYNRPTSDRGARFAEKIRAMFASGAFFAATIAYTVMAGASFFGVAPASFASSKSAANAS